MTLDADLTEFKDQLALVADRTDIGVLSTHHDIAAGAKKRTRRTRLLGGAGALVLLLGTLMGVGLANRGEDTSALFANQIEAPNTTPSTAVWVGDEYIGIAALDPFEPGELDNVTSIIVSSPDGVEWEPVSDAPEITSSNGLAFAEYDGIFHLIGVRNLEGPTGADPEWFHATSADLVEWTEIVQEVSTLWDEPGRALQAVDAESGAVGTLIAVRTGPSFPDISEELAELGLDRSEVCDSTIWPNRARVRPCGSTETITTGLAETPIAFTFETHFFFAPPGGPFREVELPEPDPSRPSLTSPFPTIYRVPGGLGLVAHAIFESTDGQTWVESELSEAHAAMVAAQGSERVFWSSFPVQRFGPGDPVKGAGYSSDGSSWEAIDVDSLFDNEGSAGGYFNQLQAATPGWVVVAQRELENDPEVTGVTRNGSGRSDFAIAFDGYLLAGEAPYGPATLTDAGGVVVRSWEQFETANPVWSGLIPQGGDLVVPNEVTGEPLGTITSAQWQAILEPQGPNWFSLLHSYDGTNWSIIDSSSSSPHVLAIGDNEIVVNRSHPGRFDLTVPEVETIPLPLADE